MLRAFTGVLGAVMLMACARDAFPEEAFVPLPPSQVRAIMVSQHRHVRAVDKRAEAAIAEGLGRSGTFARLVLALDESDVIVYIETALRLPPALSGRLLLAGRAGGYRYLRIQVSAVPQGNDLIALVGHELQHALEVASAPYVRDEQTLMALYQSIGLSDSSQHRYDTIAAQHAGRRVRTELIGSGAKLKAEV